MNNEGHLTKMGRMTQDTNFSSSRAATRFALSLYPSLVLIMLPTVLLSSCSSGGVVKKERILRISLGSRKTSTLTHGYFLSEALPLGGPLPPPSKQTTARNVFVVEEI